MFTFLIFLKCCLCFHFIVLDATELHFEAHSSIQFDNFVEHKSHYLAVSKHSETRVHEFGDCAMECLECSSCLSVNMASFPDDGELFWCELLLADMFNNSQNFKENATSHHFSKWSPCLKKPCLNGGSCVANYHDDTHKCICEPGFAGKNCQLDIIDDCAPNPCENGGSCIDGFRDYTCSCAVGFDGKNCSCNIGDGWTAFNNHCYKLFSELKTWSAAKTHCESVGSLLASIHSREENDFVRTLISTQTWLGGNDIASDGAWVWEDGEDWGGFTSWPEGEPNGGEIEQCLWMRYDEIGNWNDAPCDGSKPHVCKK